MSNSVPTNRLSFEENINTLLEELALASKWQRPSILLAVHKSKFGQDRAKSTLEDRLKDLGQSVVHVVVDKDHSDVPHRIASIPAAARSIFFVSNIDWGGGEDRKDAYRALNIYREIFVDNRLRLVFWLTTNEAAELARFAPDFWAFRHRVVEFVGERLPRKVNLPAGVLLWDMQNSVDPFDTLEARIAVREELLARLPRNGEARSARVDLLYNLGYLYWMMCDVERAAQEFTAGLELTADEAARAKAPLLNGLAIIAYEARQYDRSADLFQQALQDGPDDAPLLMNLGAALAALGRNYEAITQARKAARLAPRDPRIWAAMGYLHAAMGKFDEAIPAFSQALELAPRVAAYHSALAICYDLVERTEETARHLEQARKLIREQARVTVDIYEAAIVGDTSRSLNLARAAFRADQLSPCELRRDPNLSLLLDLSQIEQLST